MRKSYIWSLALAAFAVSGAVAASALAPALTRAEEGEGEVTGVSEVAYILDPESGAIVNDLQTISISFPENRNVQVNEKMELNSIVLTNTETGVEYYCDSPVRDSRFVQGAAYTLYFVTPAETEDGEAALKPITTPGAYELSITQGAFIYGEEVEAEDGSISLENIAAVQEISASYTVVEAVPAIAYTLEPEDGAIVNDLQTITISFEDRNVQPNDKMELNAIVLTDENGEEYYCDAPVRADRAAQGVAYTLSFLTSVESPDGIEEVLKPITAPGEYKLSILKGTFVRGDEVEDEEGVVTLENVVPVEAINATYKVVEAAPAIAYTLEPEDGAIVNDLQTITISFEDRNVQPNDKMELNAIVLTDENGEEYYCDAPVRADRAAQGVAYTLSFLTSVESPDGIEEVLKPITAPGEYKLSILKGTFVCGDEIEGEDGVVTLENVVAVEAINASYTVVEAAPAIVYTLEPEDGAIVNEIQTITISFEDKNVQPNAMMEFNAIVLTDANGEEYYCDEPVRADRVAEGVAYTLNFLSPIETPEGLDSEFKPINTPGEYKLSILKGTFIRGDEVEAEDGAVTLENVVPVEAINATYTVVAAAPSIAYALDPEDGAIVNDLQTITISFENKNVQPNAMMEFNAIVLTDTDGNEYFCDAPVRDARAAQGVAYTLTFLTEVVTADGIEYVDAPISAPGEYKLSILKGTFVCGDEVEAEDGTVTLENVVAVEAINASYTVVEAAPAIAYALDPEDGAYVEDLQAITISFPETKTVVVNERILNAIVLTNVETGKEYVCDYPEMNTFSTEGTSFILRFIAADAEQEGLGNVLEPITADGTYKLSIMEGAFLYGEEVEDEEGNVVMTTIMPVQAIDATYSITSTGVNAVFGADASDLNVYGVNGMRILKAADSNAVNALPAGLYIINGKKVIKK